MNYSSCNLLDIDECESRPCMNNGTCTDGLNDYTCECMAGYTGPNCELIGNMDQWGHTRIQNNKYMYILYDISFIFLKNNSIYKCYRKYAFSK